VFLSLAAILVLNLLVFRDHWKGLTSFPFNFPLTYYAATSYWIASLQTGEWPHWIPYQSLGYPAIMNAQMGLFYPPFWLFVLFRLPYTLHAANVLAVLHVLFGSIGFFCFGRRSFRTSVAVCGAICFGLFGGFYGSSEDPDITRAFSWVPWLFWALVLGDTPASRGRPNALILTRLCTPNLFLPPILFCLITGSYPGLIISSLLVTTVFLVLQVATLFWVYRDRAIIRDGIIQCAQVTLGLGMAMVYLWPLGYMSRILSRTYDAATYQPWYLHPTHFYQLFLPSNLLSNEDYSMYAMQLPLVLLMFLPLARLRAGLLAMVLSSGLVSALMSFSGLSRVSGFIARLLPVFRLSRFPAGDYRIFLYFAVLICALAGIERACVSRQPLLRNTVIMFAALGALLALSVLIFRTPLPARTRETLSIFIALEGVVCALAASAYVLLVNNQWPAYLWVHLITAACILIMIPTLAQMKPFWSDPAIEHYIYGRQGLELKQPAGRLTVYGIFQRWEDRRPARTARPPVSPGVFPLLWRGYIDGSYMTFDLGGGSKSIGLRNVLSNSSLMTLMEEPGELRAIGCSSRICTSASVEDIDLLNAARVGTPLRYSRNYVSYYIFLSVRALVVENEMAAPGWVGYCETHGEHLAPVVVDGALRGWVLGPGQHRVRLTYRTPMLAAGAILSAGCFVFWLISTILLGPSRPREPAP